MILPGSFTFSLILLILGIACWGAWAYMFKIRPGRWRFELFYIDFAIGAALAAMLLAFTVGTFGDDGFSVLDDLGLAGKRQDLLAFLAGVVFNLGNMLLTGSLSLTGMALAFPVGWGVGIVVGAGWRFFLTPTSNPVFLFGGAALVLAAAIVTIVAYRSHAIAQLLLMVQQGKTRSTKKTVTSKGWILALVAGVFLGCFTPVLEIARAGEIGLGPYSAVLLAAVGILISTVVFNLFFTNLPIQGDPVDVTDYLRAKIRTHTLGILAGVIWSAGTVAVMVAGRAEGVAQINSPILFGLMQAPVLVATLLGMFRFQEYKDADTRNRFLLTACLFLLVAGIGLIGLSQVGVARA